MESNVRKVRVVQNDGLSELVQVEDEYGLFWTRRRRVHMVGDEAFITTDRQADMMRRALARADKKKALADAKEKLAEPETVEV